MPELTFVLPHWLYWSGLLLFPLLAMWFFRRARARTVEGPPVSLGLGYFLLLTGGFIGVHRLYVRSRWAVVFILVFVAVLVVNKEVRLSRTVLSEATNAITLLDHRLKRANKNLARAERRIKRRDSKRNQARRDKVLQAIEAVKTERPLALAAQADAQTLNDRWHQMSSALAIALLLGILIDAVLLPKLVRERNAIEKPPSDDGFVCPTVEEEHDDTTEPLAIVRWISRINGLAGEYVAYWSIIAVFVYYYEVVARYVFNSPTNWAHEGMFLMFGMQYLIAGGFCLREGAHVRVDVLYTHLSTRGKAIADLITSGFFFVFVLTLLVTGWTFFHDAYQQNEHSFTEWGVHYWPIKFALPAGATLLFIQGLALLMKDILAVFKPGAVTLQAESRPEA